MGDRANIVFEYKHGDKSSRIYLYGHWAGGMYLESLARTLDRGVRWGDPAYLCRMVFCDLVGKENFEGTTGFGIAPYPPDNDGYDLAVVDCRSGTVSLETYPGYVVVERLSFREYIDKYLPVNK